MKPLKVSALLLLLMISITAVAQDHHLKIDLALPAEDTLALDVDNNKHFKIRVINLEVDKKYMFFFKKNDNEIAPIPFEKSSLAEKNKTAKRDTLLKPIRMMRGDVYNLTIYEYEDGKRTNTWNYILKAPKRGSWDVSYGYAFALNAFNKEGAYYLDQQDSTYIITESNRENFMDFIPSIFFTYNHWPENPWSWGVSAGLGINSEAPSVFLGGSLIIQRNLSLTVGLAAYKLKDLHSKYNSGDVLTEILEDDQLHQEYYTFNPFVTLSLRFDKSPFGGGD